MKTQWIVSLLLALGLTLSFTGLSRGEDKKEKKEEHEKQVDISKVPAAARTAIEKEVGDGKLTKVLEGADTEGGKATYYEAKYTSGGKRLQVKVDPDGKVLEKAGDDD